MVSNENYAVWIFTLSNDNKVYYNNFLNNNGGGVQAADYGTNNFWDAGFMGIQKGNYWSDYTTRYPGAVQDPTGTYWMTPYVVDPIPPGTSQDNYPLVNPVP